VEVDVYPFQEEYSIIVRIINQLKSDSILTRDTWHLVLPPSLTNSWHLLIPGDVDLHFLIGKLSGKNIGLIQEIFSPRAAEGIFSTETQTAGAIDQRM
jgi:hypothetical protein